MSSLALVRHAQASCHADHYDQLSPLGERQACGLGEAWVRQRRVIDEVFVGPRARQRHTAELVATCYQRAGLPFPEPLVLPELDEYDLGGILHRLAPALAEQDVEFAALHARQRQGVTSRERERSFQLMFERLLRHWQSADALAEALESWREFSERVARGLKHIVNRPGTGRRVVAFTSGGFIGTAVQHTLAAPPHAALEINWRIRNGAVTEFVFTRDRITVDSFNSVAHFDDPELITFR